MGAGVLPISIKNNKIYFLFGKENKYNDTPGWADFGGGTEPNENILNGAVREAWEESTGFLGSKEEIKKRILKWKKTFQYDRYTTFLMPMEYDDKLIYYFNNNQKCIEKKLDPKIIKNSYIFEKDELKWFSFEELEKNIHSFRSFYQNMVKILLENKKEIKKLFIKRNKTKKSFNNI